MKKLLLMLVLIAAGLVAALPAGIGWLAHRQSSQWSEQFNTDHPDWELNLVEYDRGWWTSRAHWQLRHIGSRGAGLSKGLRADIHQDIYHGPFANTENGARWALISLDSRIAATWPQTDRVFAADADTTLGLGLRLAGELNWQAFQQQTDDQRIDLRPGSLTLEARLNQDAWALTVQSQGGQWNDGNSHTAWGPGELTISHQPEIGVRAALNTQRLAHLDQSLESLVADWQSSPMDGDLWQHQVDLSTSGLTTPNRNLDSLQLEAEMDRLHASAATRVLQALLDVERAQLDSRNANNARAAVLLQHLPAVLEHRPSLTLHSFSMSGERGQASVQGQVDLDQASRMQLASPLMLEQGASLQARIELDRSMLIDLLVRHYQSQGEAWRSEEDDRRLYERLAEQQIDTWLESGMLTRGEADLRADIDLARGGWLINDQPWVRGL